MLSNFASCVHAHSKRFFHGRAGICSDQIQIRNDPFTNTVTGIYPENDSLTRKHSSTRVLPHKIVAGTSRP